MTLMVANSGPTIERTPFDHEPCGCVTCARHPESFEARKHTEAHAAFAAYIATRGERAGDFVPPTPSRMTRAIAGEFDPAAFSTVCVRASCMGMPTHPAHQEPPRDPGDPGDEGPA